MVVRRKVVNFALCLNLQFNNTKSSNKRFITCFYKRVKDEGNILHTIKRRMADWIGHVLTRKCLLKHFIEGDMEGTGEEEKDVSSCPAIFRKT